MFYIDKEVEFIVHTLLHNMKLLLACIVLNTVLELCKCCQKQHLLCWKLFYIYNRIFLWL